MIQIKRVCISAQPWAFQNLNIKIGLASIGCVLKRRDGLFDFQQRPCLESNYQKWIQTAGCFSPIPESYLVNHVNVVKTFLWSVKSLLQPIQGCSLQVFVMFHATREIENVAGVLDQGFKISQSKGRNLLLGDGLYVSRDILKTQEYGEVSRNAPHGYKCPGLKCRSVSNCWSILARLLE